MSIQIGTTLKSGVGAVSGITSITGYCVINVQDGGSETRFEDIFSGSTGERVTRIYFNKDEKISLQLIAESAANPKTDFPEHAKCTVAGLTDYIVESCTIDESEGPTRVSVQLKNIGI